jgi:hypothetical protein
MNFVHTFWSKPFLSNRFNKYQELLPIILTDYAYSCSCVKSHGHSIRLFTDKFGADFLGFIPYDEIVVLDNLENESIDFAAQIKFDALKQMKLDEILIDGDLFIRSPQVFEMIDSINYDVLYSFYEPVEYTLMNFSKEKIEYYNRILTVVNNLRTEFIQTYSKEFSINDCYWPNTSLLKFSNQELKDKYIEQYEYHKNLLSNCDFGHSWPDIWIEQKHLELLVSSKYKGRPLIYCYPSKGADLYASTVGFTHLGAGKVKYQEPVLKNLFELDKKLYDLLLNQIEIYRQKNKPL